MIRRHKTTIFTDAKESSTVFELKRIVEGILKRPPDEQRLYKDDQLLDDGKTLGECGFTSQTARPQAPATVGLAFRAGERGLGWVAAKQVGNSQRQSSGSLELKPSGQCLTHA
uniref:Elongin-B n=1 Tax=Callithrix jacchus TaxID=9483 RepID=A0A8I3W793_CALJA